MGIGGGFANRYPLNNMRLGNERVSVARFSFGPFRIPLTVPRRGARCRDEARCNFNVDLSTLPIWTLELIKCAGTVVLR